MTPKSTFLLVLLTGAPVSAQAPLEVVTTLPAYAAIVREVGGDRVTVASIARPDEDAHFVQPKPSFALLLQDADLFVTTGLDLELWAPVLVDKSGNRDIRDGAPGFVAASPGIALREIPTSTSREAGDIHIYGNPHIFTSPVEAKAIARNIAAGLERVDRAGAAVYRENLASFERRIDVALYGEELVDLLGAATLDPLARDGKLIPFLESQGLEGRPLIERLGGWLERARPLRGREAIAYHKEWVYLADLLGLTIVDHVEPKPGIPPSARHVHELVERIERERIPALLVATYTPPSAPAAIAERTGIEVLWLPLGPEPAGTATYFDLVQHWIDRLAAAYAG